MGHGTRLWLARPQVCLAHASASSGLPMAGTALGAMALDLIEKRINDDQLLAAIEPTLSGEAERIDNLRAHEEMLKRLA